MAVANEGFIDVDDARNLLHQYSEWLDVNGSDTDDGRTHDDLVEQFISDRDIHARPMLEKRTVFG